MKQLFARPWKTNKKGKWPWMTRNKQGQLWYFPNLLFDKFPGHDVGIGIWGRAQWTSWVEETKLWVQGYQRIKSLQDRRELHRTALGRSAEIPLKYSAKYWSAHACEEKYQKLGKSHQKELTPSIHTVLRIVLSPISHTGTPQDS